MAAASSSRSSGVIVLYSAARHKTIERTPLAVSVRRVFMPLSYRSGGRRGKDRRALTSSDLTKPQKSQVDTASLGLQAAVCFDAPCDDSNPLRPRHRGGSAL